MTTSERVPGGSGPEMLVTILGSGTLLPNDERHSPAHLVEVGGRAILLDCGSGTLHGLARHGVAWSAITHLALSHFHTDHTGDLAPLLWAFKHGLEGGRTERFTVLGPSGLTEMVEATSRAHGPYVRDPGFPMDVVELERSGRWSDGSGLVVRTSAARHTPEAVAYRVEAGDAVVGYTGDTGPAPALQRFFRGVDLLIAECALSDERAIDSHLSPTTLARLLAGARPGLAVLTHVYPPLDPEQVPDLVRAAGFTGRLVAGKDGLRIRLPLDGPDY